MQVQFKTFESQFLTRQKMLQKAAEFATQMGPERLINVTHSEDHHESLITVWYWEGEIPAAGAPPACISDPSRDTTPDSPQTRAKLSDSSRTGNAKEPESAVYTR
jgi:hypothetical protein